MFNGGHDHEQYMGKLPERPADRKMGVECPGCGNHVEFDPGRKKVICSECHTSFDPYYWEDEV